MKKQLGFLLLLTSMFAFTACETVKSGHRGVEVSWGGETNTRTVYPEGMQNGFHWIWDDLVEYDVREKTLVQQFEFNDKNNMVTRVELSLDYNLHPDKVHLLHTQITDVETKIVKTLKSAGKEVVPQYSAVDLNISKRVEAEQLLSKIISEELQEFYVEFKRIQMTDVDIPAKVAKLAEETAVQLGRNELASKLKVEKENIADALVAESKGKYEAAQYDAKTKDIMSQPKMLLLMEKENERLMWEGYKKHGHSPFGNNNMYGVTPAIIKGLQ